MKKTFLFILFLMSLSTTVLSAPTFYLLADTTDKGEVFQGEPIVLTAGLTDIQAQLASAENYAKKLQLADLLEKYKKGKISEERYKSETAKIDTTNIPLAIIGSESAPWFEDIIWRVKKGENYFPLGWRFSVLKIPEPQNSLRISHEGSSETSFGMEPEATEKIEIGEYTIRAGLLPRAFVDPTTTDTVWSNDVVIKVLKSIGSPDNWDFERRLNLASYWQRKGDFTKSLAEIEKVLKERPNDINALYIKANALAEFGRYEEALTILQQAIALYYRKDHSCPPDILIEKSIEIRNKMLEKER